MFKLENGIYINTQQITHIVPNEGGNGAIAFFVNGKSVSLSDNDLKWIDSTSISYGTKVGEYIDNLFMGSKIMCDK